MPGDFARQRRITRHRAKLHQRHTLELAGAATFGIVLTEPCQATGQGARLPVGPESKINLENSLSARRQRSRSRWYASFTAAERASISIC